MGGIGIILEGGGMRGVYTGGVLETLLENNINFPYVIGVSAGASQGASYVSKQKGRNRAVTIDYAGNPDYFSYKYLLKKGELFNMDFIYGDIPNVKNPFDYESFSQSQQVFYIGTTDCKTGKPVYYEKSEIKDDLNKILRASSSLPFVAKIVEHEGRHLLDGGISDPIPIKKSIEDGNKKNVVILTQCKGYVKEAAKRGKWLLRKKYSDFPGLIEALDQRADLYNETIRFIERQEEEGKAFVFRPDDLMGVGRTEQKKEKLEALYAHGIEQAASRLSELKDFIR